MLIVSSCVKYRLATLIINYNCVLEHCTDFSMNTGLSNAQACLTVEKLRTGRPFIFIGSRRFEARRTLLLFKLITHSNTCPYEFHLNFLSQHFYVIHKSSDWAA